MAYRFLLESREEALGAAAADWAAFRRERLVHFNCPEHVEFGRLLKTVAGKRHKKRVN